MGETAVERQRLDKWLWHARFCRARATAVDLVESGHVRINGVRSIDPGKGVKSGDVLTLALAGKTIVVKVLTFLEKRGSPALAQTSYDVIVPDKP